MVGDKPVILLGPSEQKMFFVEVWLKPVEYNADMVTIQDYTSGRVEGNETDEKREFEKSD